MTTRRLPILEAERVTLRKLREQIVKCHFCTTEHRCVPHDRMESRLISKCYPTGKDWHGYGD